MDHNNDNNLTEETINNSGQEQDPKNGSSRLALEVYDWLQSLVFALLVCVLTFVFLFRMVTVVGHSMVPTLHDQDKIIISKIGYTPEVGDIVVLRMQSFREDPIVKRIIAKEGQVIDIDFDQAIVYVDGVAIEEDYIAAPTLTRLDFVGPVTVPEGCVFVMGDNRNDSTDSRDDRIGFVDERYIMGKVLITVYPLSDFGSNY